MRKRLQNKSFYTLELFIEPGGGRMSWVVVLKDLKEIKKVLESYFEEDEQHLSMYCLLFYGTHIFLQTYQDGIRTQEIDLIPFINVNMHGYKTFKAMDWKRMTEMQSINETKNFKIEDQGELFFDSRNNVMGLSWDVNIDWDKMKIEPLNENKFTKGKVKFYNHYVEQENWAKYGIYEDEEDFYKKKIDWSNIWDIS